MSSAAELIPESEDAGRRRWRATGVGSLAVLLWASLALLTTATAGVPPFQVLALSFLTAGVSGLLVLLLRGAAGLRALRQPPAAWTLSIGALFLYHAFFFIALKRAPAVEANLINYLWPLLIVVFAALLPGARVRGAQMLGAGLGLSGTVLLLTRSAGVGMSAEHLWGYTAAFAAALTWSAYSVLNRRFHSIPSAAIAGSCLAVGLLGGLAHWLFETSVSLSATQWWVILAMGLGPVGGAFWLWDHGTKHGELAVLGTLAYAAPLLSTGLLLIFGQASAHWTQAVALGLLLLGAWLSVRGSRIRRDPD